MHFDLYTVRAESLSEQYIKLLEPGLTTYPSRFTIKVLIIVYFDHTYTVLRHCVDLYCVSNITCILFPYCII